MTRTRATLVILLMSTCACVSPTRQEASSTKRFADAIVDGMYKEGVLKNLRCDLQSAFVDHIEWQRHTDLQRMNLANALSVACRTKERISIYAAFDTERRNQLR
jgi:hypothetical protein